MQQILNPHRHNIKGAEPHSFRKNQLGSVTDRTHPLRIHLAAIGHPIIGDALYGKEAERLLLHASELRFAHPASGELLDLKSDPPF